MISGWLNPHAPGDSFIHRLSAEWKLGIGLVLIVGTVTLPLRYSGWFWGVAGILFLAIILSRLSWLFLARRLFVLTPFVLGVALVNAFQPQQRGPWTGVALRSGLCLLIAVLVSSTTPFNQLIRVLRLAHAPSLLVTTITLMYRYLFVLTSEAERMRRARLSRTFTRQRGVTWRSLATLVGQLFVRASERAERIYDAMCARGWK